MLRGGREAVSEPRQVLPPLVSPRRTVGSGGQGCPAGDRLAGGPQRTSCEVGTAVGPRSLGTAGGAGSGGRSGARVPWGCPAGWTARPRAPLVTSLRTRPRPRPRHSRARCQLPSRGGSCFLRNGEGPRTFRLEAQTPAATALRSPRTGQVSSPGRSTHRLPVWSERHSDVSLPPRTGKTPSVER